MYCPNLTCAGTISDPLKTRHATAAKLDRFREHGRGSDPASALTVEGVVHDQDLKGL